MKTFDDCLAFVQRTPNGFLATVEGDRPRVRPMTVWLADRTGLYFYTSKVKPLFAQLQRKPQVEIAFHAPGKPPDLGATLRVAGEIELVEDMAVRNRLHGMMPWMKKLGASAAECPTIVVFRLARGRFNFWTWENNVKPGPWLPFP